MEIGYIPKDNGFAWKNKAEQLSKMLATLRLQPLPYFFRKKNPMSHQSDLISTDINAYLAQYERKELLRFLTCGNVDDGKSCKIIVINLTFITRKYFNPIYSSVGTIVPGG